MGTLVLNNFEEYRLGKAPCFVLCCPDRRSSRAHGPATAEGPARTSGSLGLCSFLAQGVLGPLPQPMALPAPLPPWLIIKDKPDGSAFLPSCSSIASQGLFLGSGSVWEGGEPRRLAAIAGHPGV